MEVSRNDPQVIDNSNIKVLVVEDDELFRKLIQSTLERSGYKVRTAENGLVAKTIFDLAPDEFDIVLSDVKMPVMDGVALIEHVKKAKGASIRFIMMTGFAEALEAKQALELGADEFLSKPFRAEILEKTIQKCLNPTSPENVDHDDERNNDYCQIPIDHFLSSSNLISDLYIKLGKSKFIKVAASSEEIPIERLRTYRSKKVEFLFVRREDYGKYVNFALKLTKLASKSDKVNASQKAQLFRHTTEILHNQVFFTGMDKTALGHAKDVVGDVVKTISEDRQILILLTDASNQGDSIYAHNLMVSVLASMVAKEHGWSAPASLFKCVVGGLFHDVGKRELSPELSTKSRLLLSAEEIALFETHPSRGRDILIEISALPDEIPLIVFHHHEYPNGQGYPQRLSGEQIHPIAKLIGVVDRFCTLAFPIRDGTTPLSTSEALSRMMTIHFDELDPTFSRRLLSLFPNFETKAS